MTNEREENLHSRYNKGWYPNWVDSEYCDAETLIEIAREMTEFFLESRMHLEDSRCLHRICVDMAHDFQTLHKKTDWEKADFLPQIMFYAKCVKQKLLAQPNWINTHYKWMYGRETISDLLSKACSWETPHT